MKQKIIFDNIIFSLQKYGGISVYWYELLKRINAELYLDYLSANELRKDLNLKSALCIKKKCNPKLELLKKETNYKEGIFHSSYYRISKNQKNIVTIHDFTHEKMFKGYYRYANILLKRRAIYNADYIICISENTKDDLLKLYPDIKKEISVIHNGVSIDYYQKPIDHNHVIISNVEKKAKNKKIVLYVGSRQTYKNFNLLYESLKNNYFLVIVGGGDISDEELRNLNKYMFDSYIHLMGVSNKDLNELYNLAYCLIYPSDYEGFGIPVVEAMKAGCPVICNNSSSLSEVGGDAAVFMNENTSDGILKSLKKLKVKDFRIETIQKGIDNAKKFNWDKTAMKTKQIYDGIKSL